MSICPTRAPSLRRLFAVAVLALLAGTSLTLVKPATAAAAAPGDAEKSILLVGITWEGFVEYPTTDGGLAWSDPVAVFSTCTGWFASDVGHIVTAGHCVDPAEGKAALLEQFLVDMEAEYLLPQAMGTWRVEGEQQGSEPLRSVEVVQPSAVEGAVITSPMTVQVLDYQPLRDGDVALLKANGLSKPTPPLPVASEPASIGDDVTAIGFPATVQAVSDVSRIRASFKSGTVSSSQISPDGVAGTEVNADISAGMSGGPTINDRGEVLGVNSFIINGEQRNFNFITDASALRSYLEQQDVPLASASPPSSEPAPGSSTAGREGSSGIPAWLFVVAGIAVLLLAAMLLVLLRRRPKPQAAGHPAAPQAPYAPQRQVMHSASPGENGHPAAPQAPYLPHGQAVQSSPGGESCNHANVPPGARFCQDCGRALVS